jgi:hypothetical protein
LDAAIASGDRGALYALYMGAKKRKGGNATAFDGALERAETALVGDWRDKAAEGAGDLVQEAINAEIRVGNLKVGAKNTADRWADQRLRAAYRTAEELRAG